MDVYKCKYMYIIVLNSTSRKMQLDYPGKGQRLEKVF